MKIPVVLEWLLLCALVAFVSAKSVDRRYGRGQPLMETTTPKLNLNISSPDNSMRQEIISQEVQVVQEFTDSQEQVTSAAEHLEQSDANPISEIVKPLETNEIEQPEPIKPVNDKPLNENDPNPINKFCSCSSASCKCCRDFSIPLIPIRGPGCATVRYLDNDKLSIGIKYGDIVLASRTVDSRRPSPICLPLPGGYNRFCGRVYGISRENENFKACLGLELRADDDVEASLRVSCFQFGPKGLATMEAEPLPPNITDDDDDDDDDDPLGIGALAGDDDDDDDDDDYSDEEGAPGPGGLVGDILGGILGGGGGGGGDDDDDGDLGIFRFFSDFDFFGGDNKKSKKKPNDDIAIDRKNDEKTKKKPEFEKKTPKKTANKVTEEDDKESDGSILESIQNTFEELTNDEELSTDSTTKENESEAVKDDDYDKDYKDDDDDDDDGDDDINDDDDDYSDEKADKDKTETKPSKKKKVTSSFGLDYLGRLFNFFA